MRAGARRGSDFPLTILRPAATYNDTWAPISLLGSGTGLLKRIRYTITWEEGVRRMVAYHDALGAIDSAPDDPLYERVIEVFSKHAAMMEQGLA